MSKIYTEDELANLSDDELMGMAVAPVMADEPDDGNNNSDPNEPPATTEGEEDPDVSSGSPADAESDPDGDDDPTGDTGGEDPGASQGSTTTAPVEGDKSQAKQDATKPADQTKSQEPQGPSDTELKDLYAKVMGGFKANGKEIKLQSPDEAVRLMQMGANYTKKLQALQPQMKLLRMLENNGLLDEGKLSYLIDLDKKNPAAIQKFIKESGVDPLEIDTAAETSYQPGNHGVSDAEMAFQSTLDDLMIEKSGQDTIVAVNRTWDQPSKQALMQDPNILRVVHEQRQNGIYQKITDEIDRRRLLGQLPSAQPFLHAYLAVGKEMDSQGLLAPQPAAVTQPGRVVDTRPAIRPTNTVINNDKARAASPTSSSPKKVTQDFNPLAMSDEEFEKTAALASRL